MELVTIGITCWNAHDTILRALQCAVNQTYMNKEIIVVDDCSSDGSWEVITKFSQEHDSVHAYRLKLNSGYAEAINTIVSKARGGFISIFDDDDVSTPDRVEKQIAHLCGVERECETDAVLCYTNRGIVKAQDHFIDHIALAIGRSRPYPKGIEVVDYLLGIDAAREKVWGQFGSCTLTLRRNSFKKLGGFDTSFRRSAEFDFAIRAAFSSFLFTAVNEPLVTQFKTVSIDKKGSIPLKYSVKLRKKYRGYLKEKRAYWASIIFSYANHNYRFNRKLLYYILRIIGYACSPVLLMKYIKRKI